MMADSVLERLSQLETALYKALLHQTPEAGMSTLLEAAEHWEVEAAALSRESAAYARRRGFDGLYHPGDFNADLYETVAKSLRLKYETGSAHCLCHLMPSDQCVFALNKKNQ